MHRESLQRESPRRESLRLAPAVCAWLGVVVGGTGALTWYSGQPGARGATPDRIPVEERAAEVGPRLFVLIHPRCPCSRATVAELERIVVHVAGKLAIQIYYFTPPDVSAAAAEAFADTAVVRAARAVPGARVDADPGAKRSIALGAMTSGHAVLYDGDGRLRFSGGLTAARGHEEPSPARHSILAVVGGEAPGALESPVFGCPLTASGDG